MHFLLDSPYVLNYYTLMTLIPFILSIIAVYRLWDSDHSTLKWLIIGVTIFYWLCNEAVRNSRKRQALSPIEIKVLESTEDSDWKVTKFWMKISLGMFFINCGIAIYGIVVTL